MKKLNEFATLGEAQAYQEITYRLLSKNIIVGALRKANLLRWVWTESANDDDLFAVTISESFDFDPDSLMGSENLQTLEGLIGRYSDQSEALAAVRDGLVAMAQTVTYPFSEVQLHEFQTIKGESPMKSVGVVDGYAVIQTAADCPEHHPALYAQNPRTSIFERINNFRNVKSAGTYDCLIPIAYRAAEIKVADHYGVIL